MQRILEMNASGIDSTSESLSSDCHNPITIEAINRFSRDLYVIKL